MGVYAATASSQGAIYCDAAGRAVVEAAEAEEAAGTADGAKKKRKTKGAGEDGGAGAAASGSGVTVSEASVVMAGHLNCVAAVSWPAEDTLYSGGWDHSVSSVVVTEGTELGAAPGGCCFRLCAG